MSRRSSRILAVLGVVFLAAGVAATMQDDGRRWKVHDKNRPQPPMVTPGMESTGERPGTAPSDAIVLLSPETGRDAAIRAAIAPLIGAIDVEAMREANLSVDREEDKLTFEEAARRLADRIGL